jgi:DNA replication ATP-dependent helicase Dna2
MLMRLAEKYPTSVAALTYQYRMNEEICKLSSYLIYGGRLKCGNEEVRHRKLDLPGFPHALPATVSPNKGLWPWLKMTVSPDNPVIFVDTDNMRKSPTHGNTEKVAMEALEEKRGGRAGGKVTNPIEAIVVRYIIKGLVSTGANPKQIGVISPFRAQVKSPA